MTVVITRVTVAMMVMVPVPAEEGPLPRDQMDEISLTFVGHAHTAWHLLTCLISLNSKAVDLRAP